MDFSPPLNLPRRLWMPPRNVLTHGIDVQEGVLDHLNGDYIGAVYTADYGTLGTGILIQNSSPSASWQNAIQYSKNGNLLFSVDGAGNIVGSNASLVSIFVDGDPINGSVDVGNLTNSSATPLYQSQRLRNFPEQCENDQRCQWPTNHRHRNRRKSPNQRKWRLYGWKFSRKPGHSLQFVRPMHNRPNRCRHEAFLCLRCDQYVEALGAEFFLDDARRLQRIGSSGENTGSFSFVLSSSACWADAPTSSGSRNTAPVIAIR